MQFAAAEPFLNRPRLRFRRHRPQGIDPKFSDSLSRNGVGEVWNSGSLGWPITGKMKLGGLVPICQIVSADSGRITRHFHEKAGRVKPFFMVVPFVQSTADQREAFLAFSLSFLERFFVRLSIQPIADRREAHNAAIPNFQITDSPYFHPHS
jgi:hypothetical protein